MSMELPAGGNFNLPLIDPAARMAAARLTKKYPPNTEEHAIAAMVIELAFALDAIHAQIQAESLRQTGPENESSDT